MKESANAIKCKSWIFTNNLYFSNFDFGSIRFHPAPIFFCTVRDDSCEHDELTTSTVVSEKLRD